LNIELDVHHEHILIYEHSVEHICMNIVHYEDMFIYDMNIIYLIIHGDNWYEF